MSRKVLAALALAAVAGAMAVIWVPWASSAPSNASACGTSYAPVLDPANFVTVIDNPYFPLPVGRKLVYTGVKTGRPRRIPSPSRVRRGSSSASARRS